MKIYTVDNFLFCPTPEVWLQTALENRELLLIDHAHCEKKAAATALGLIYRYSDQPILLEKMSKLAREELRHFEQVLGMIKKRGEVFRHLTPSRYATSLHRFVTNHEPNKLIDSLILGAFIEARSCERFRLLAQYLDSELALFYSKLYHAEARHFEEYLNLAQQFSTQSLDDRIIFFAEKEAELINQEEEIFRFHSGPLRI